MVRLVRPGMTLAQIDQHVAKTLERLGCKSCFLGYRQSLNDPKFPSHACLSVNECVVHGTAGYFTRPLRAGDVLKIDIGVSHKGWIGDAAWTYSIGPASPEVRRLLDAGRQSLSAGIQALVVGRKLRDWAIAVQEHVEQRCGLHLVRGLGGHGYGRRLHEPPYVSNVIPRTPGEWSDAERVITPGMLLAVEPMIGVGTGKTRHTKGHWPILTGDGSLSSHHEHDVMTTNDGPQVLTAGLEALPDELPA